MNHTLLFALFSFSGVEDGFEELRLVFFFPLVNQYLDLFAFSVDYLSFIFSNFTDCHIIIVISFEADLLCQLFLALWIFNFKSPVTSAVLSWIISLFFVLVSFGFLIWGLHLFGSTLSALSHFSLILFSLILFSCCLSLLCSYHFDFSFFSPSVQILKTHVLFPLCP